MYNFYLCWFTSVYRFFLGMVNGSSVQISTDRTHTDTHVNTRKGSLALDGTCDGLGKGYGGDIHQVVSGVRPKDLDVDVFAHLLSLPRSVSLVEGLLGSANVVSVGLLPGKGPSGEPVTHLSVTGCTIVEGSDTDSGVERGLGDSKHG